VGDLDGSLRNLGRRIQQLCPGPERQSGDPGRRLRPRMPPASRATHLRHHVVAGKNPERARHAEESPEPKQLMSKFAPPTERENVFPVARVIPEDFVIRTEGRTLLYARQTTFFTYGETCLTTDIWTGSPADSRPSQRFSSSGEA
jgi:hypothetical protein